MQIPIYQVDAFTSRVFSGNPAAVCPLESWLPDETLLAIATENNLSETAFFVGENHEYELRWFTPTVEVELCGHATLASAHVLFYELGAAGRSVSFDTRSGRLEVNKRGDLLEMDFPAQAAQPCAVPDLLTEGLGSTPSEVLSGVNLMAVFEDQAAVAAIEPDFQALAGLDYFGVIATAPGEDADFVSRFFAPSKGVPEDPVTGSAHCTLVPYWSRRLQRRDLRAQQICPARGGELMCRHRGERVDIAGRCALYMRGTIEPSVTA